jgi:hypothetical protein
MRMYSKEGYAPFRDYADRCIYAPDRCRRERPALLPLPNGRTVACHYPPNGTV